MPDSEPVDVSRLLRRGRRAALFDASALPRVSYPRGRIEKLLPHRGPMLLLDRITGLDSSNLRIAGMRRIESGDPGLDGHFPGRPVYPGFLQLEMAGQLGLCLAAIANGVHGVNGSKGGSAATGDDDDAPPIPVRLLRVSDAHFAAEVGPGVELTVLATVLEENGYTLSAVGQVLAGTTVASVCAFEAMFLDADERGGRSSGA